MIDKLIEVISQIATTTADDIALYEVHFEEITVQKNTILEEEGKVPRYLYFVALGFMRLFYYDENGDEQTNYLCSPNGFIASFPGLINQTIATENVECITECDLLRISYSDTKKLIDKSDNFKQFSLIMLQEALTSSALRANDLASLTAEQRYAKMLKQQPYLIQNIPLQYIASFLGIKPQSLSRIRKQIK